MTQSYRESTRQSNVYINATATMLIYTSYFAGTLLMPTALAPLVGIIGGITEHTAYFSMAIHSLTAALSCPLAAFLIRYSGSRITLIVGGLCCVPFYVTMLFPRAWAIYVTQALFGYGLALVRPASLKFLTENSSPVTLPRNNGFHWATFMSSMVWGNGLLCLFFQGKTEVDDSSRMLVYGVLGAISLLAILFYMFTRKPFTLQDLDNETGALNSSTLDAIKSELAPRQWGTICSEVFSPIATFQFFILILPMLAAGFLSTLYSVQIPTLIGEVKEVKAEMALFGVMVGLGEIVGSYLSGRLNGTFGYVLVTVLSGVTGIVALILTYTNFPKVRLTLVLNPELQKELTEDEVISGLVIPKLPLLLAIALAFGLADAGNNTVLSTLIGQLFGDRSEVVFSIFSFTMNLAAMTWFIVSSYTALEFVLIATGLSLGASLIAVFCVVRPK